MRVFKTVILFVFLSLGCSKKDVLRGNLDYKTLGTSARALLSGENYTSLKIEIQYMPGYEPDAAVINNYTNFLNNFINKPGGITVTQQQIQGSGRSTVTLDDIVKIEKSNRLAFTVDNQVALHILIIDADYTTPNIVGLAYWNTSLVLFGKLLYSNSGGIGQVSIIKLESTILDNETGHILGLVDQGSPMQVPHRDPNNNRHCDNTNCLMYFAIETVDPGGIFNVNVPTLDQNCMADLKANGGK
jgi:hypothetical protein